MTKSQKGWTWIGIAVAATICTVAVGSQDDIFACLCLTVPAVIHATSKYLMPKPEVTVPPALAAWLDEQSKCWPAAQESKESLCDYD